MVTIDEEVQSEGVGGRWLGIGEVGIVRGIPGTPTSEALGSKSNAV
jgi:hypothetical protein